MCNSCYDDVSLIQWISTQKVWWLYEEQGRKMRSAAFNLTGRDDQIRRKKSRKLMFV